MQVRESITLIRKTPELKDHTLEASLYQCCVIDGEILTTT
jgi:hypothetical protein